LGSRLAFSSNTTVANAIRPSAEIALPADAPAYGLITLTTCGSFSTSANIASMCARTAGSWTLPEPTLKTIVSRSPAWVGKLRWSRSAARWASEPGSVKLFE